MNTTTTPTTTKINLDVEINLSDFFIAVVGGNFGYWITECDYKLSADDVYDNGKVCNLDVVYPDKKDDNKTYSKSITPEQLVKAYIELVIAGQTHCFGHALSVDDNDSCFGDLVLQQAIYGEIVFG